MWGNFLLIERNKKILINSMDESSINRGKWILIYYIRVVVYTWKLKNFFIKCPFDEICVPNDSTDRIHASREKILGFLCKYFYNLIYRRTNFIN